MAVVTLVNTWGGKTSNSYVGLTEANSIVSQHSLDFEVWDSVDDDQRARALIAATNNIDSLPWVGARYFWNQKLAFPRTPPGIEHPIGILQSSTDTAQFYTAIENDVYLRDQLHRVQEATALQALYLLQLRQEGARLQRHRTRQRMGIISWSRSAAGISESYSYGIHEVLAPEAWERLWYYKPSGRRLVRGDVQTFEFE